MESQRRRFASIAPCSYLLLEVVTACLDMKEDKSKKSALVCDGWNGFLGVASDLPRASYRKGKEYYLICFLAWRGWIKFSLSWHGYNLQRRRWHQNFCLAPMGEVWWPWWCIVLPCDCRHSLVSPRCSPSLKHGIFAGVVAYLVAMRGARLIGIFGIPKFDYLWTP